MSRFCTNEIVCVTCYAARGCSSLRLIPWLRASLWLAPCGCCLDRCLAVVVLAALLVAPVSGPPCLVGAAARPLLAVLDPSTRPCLAVSLLFPLSLAGLAGRFFSCRALLPC